MRFLRSHWRTILQILAWILLLVAGGSGLGGLNNEVLTLKAANHALMQAIEAQTGIIEQLRAEVARLAEENAFLRECLARPLPWPGGSLCPKPQQ